MKSLRLDLMNSTTFEGSPLSTSFATESFTVLFSCLGFFVASVCVA